MDVKDLENRTLGDYQILKKIGRGALGTLYLAQHRFMKRQYALKVLPEELASDRSFMQRFEEQMALIANLEHPHLVKVHNVSFAEGIYFLVADCIVDDMGETTNLAQFLIAHQHHQQLLDEEEVLQLLIQLAQALDFAHEKGGKLQHRNIKLNNILVSQQKKRAYYLSDFGLAHIVGENALVALSYKALIEQMNLSSAPKYSFEYGHSLAQMPLSLQQSLQQTFSFLAPEQKKGCASQSQSVDTYAFGVLAYYLLTGQYPEGCFKMPSLLRPELNYCWDAFVSLSLNPNPQERPSYILPLLEKVPLQQKRASVAVHDLTDLTDLTLAEVEMAPTKTANSELRPVIGGSQIERPKGESDPLALLHVDNAVKPYQPAPKEIKNVQPLLTEMAIIPGGAFFRGSQEGNRDEMPRHQIFLPSFALDIHPVTNEQFTRFLEAMGGEKDNNHRDLIRLKESRIKRSGGRLSIESGYAKHPVVGVTWYGALAYCRWIGKRLPTEAEWEIATCGNLTNAIYPTGETIEKSQANFFSSDTTPVMSYPKNGYGLYDMAGNVYEWCQDWYGYNYYEISQQEPDYPRGPLQGVYRVLKGGCWKSLKEDLACSRRHRNNPGTSNSTYGFRCAADVA